MIEIEELYKYYGDRRAIGPVHATIESGHVVGLLGLNGAGKTTTLRILACDLLPTSGRVRVSGIDVVEHPHAVKSKVGYLPDAPPLYGDMTTNEYLTFVAKLHDLGASEIRARVAEARERTQLSDMGDELIGSLSHGFRQRVGIAQAIVHKPELVVLDEPISGLDPVQIVEMRALIRSLAGDHTVIVSSHILSEISETCDHILVIRDGRIAAEGTERELSERLGQGTDLALTLRAPRGEARSAAVGRAEALLLAIDGVSAVVASDAPEPGDDVLGLRVTTKKDVRDVLCQRLVTERFGILGLAREARELEDVFLELSRRGKADTGSRIEGGSA